jgi:hypothetical protein
MNLPNCPRCLNPQVLYLDYETDTVKPGCEECDNISEQQIKEAEPYEL